MHHHIYYCIDIILTSSSEYVFQIFSVLLVIYSSTSLDVPRCHMLVVWTSWETPHRSHLDTRWDPLVISWCIAPVKYSHAYLYIHTHTIDSYIDIQFICIYIYTHSPSTLLNQAMSQYFVSTLDSVHYWYPNTHVPVPVVDS